MDALFVRELLRFVIIWFSHILTFAIFIRVISSWLPFRTPEILFQITEPVLGPIRRMINKSPLGGSMLDFSPIIALISIRFITNVILGVI